MITNRELELTNVANQLQADYNRVLRERDEAKSLLRESQELHLRLNERHKDLIASYGDMFAAARRANKALVANGCSPIVLPARRG